MNRQRGFSVVEASIVCVVVLLVGVLGYVFYDRWVNGVERMETAQTTPSPTTADDAPVIASTEDLGKAETALDSATLDDTTSLDSLEADLAQFN